MTAYGYVRVSTGQQAAEGDSLDAQHRQLAGYAMQHGWELATIYREEGVSGSVPLAERPQGKAMMAALKPGDVVVAAKLDRIFRSALDALQMVEELRSRSVSLHLLDLGGDVSGNGMSKLFLTIAAAFAEAERARIRERVTAAKRDQRQQGRFLGGAVPFGYVVSEEGVLVVVPEQQAAIRTILRLRKKGVALRPIAEEVQRKHGVPVSHVTVRRVLKEAGAGKQ